MNDQTQAPRPAAELSAEERDAALAFQAERLLRFGRRRKLIKDLDVLVARNTLLDLLGLAAPYEGEVPKEDLDTPTAILEPLLDLAAAKGLFDDAVPQYRINFETRLMGAMMPRESEVWPSAAPRPRRTGSMTCALRPTTSAPRRSPATSSGPPRRPTVRWRSPST